MASQIVIFRWLLLKRVISMVPALDLIKRNLYPASNSRQTNWTHSCSVIVRQWTTSASIWRWLGTGVTVDCKHRMNNIVHVNNCKQNYLYSFELRSRFISHVIRQSPFTRHTNIHLSLPIPLLITFKFTNRPNQRVQRNELPRNVRLHLRHM